MATMRPVELDTPKVHHIPEWDRMNDRERVAFLRKIAEPAGRDPRVRYLASQIVAGVEQRDYRGQADALLRWIHANIKYLNEPGEILQDVLYTLKVKHADCDDMALLLAAFCESLRLPWRFVLSGLDKYTGEKKRWIEGTPFPAGVQMAHIYVVVGWPPYKPTAWAYAEPTIKGVPLGWDVVQAANGQKAATIAGALPGTNTVLPELAGDHNLGSAGSTGGTLTAALLGESAAQDTDGIGFNWRSIFTAIIVGTAVGVGTELVLGLVRGRGKKG